MLGSDEQQNWKSIAQFDKRDADAYPKYEEFLHKARQVKKRDLRMQRIRKKEFSKNRPPFQVGATDSR